MIMLESIGGKCYVINQENNTIQNKLRKASLEVLGKFLVSYIKDQKEINGENCHYIFQLYSDLIATCVEKIKPGVFKLIEQPQSAAGKTLIGILQTSLGSKKDKPKTPTEKTEAANILIASSFEKFCSNSRSDDPYAKIDSLIQQFSEEFLLVGGTKSDTELLEQALALMPPWVNDKKDKFENLQNILLTALKENPLDDINLVNIKKRFIELKANDNYVKIEEFTRRYLSSESNVYSSITIEPGSLERLEVYEFVSEKSLYGIHQYRTTADMKMSSVIVKQTVELLDYSCLIVDCSASQSKDGLCTVLFDVMKFISDIGLSARTVITILGKLEQTLMINIRKHLRESKMKLIVISEGDPCEECLLVSDLTMESREQLHERYKQLCLFGTSIALRQIVRGEDSLSILCKVLDRCGHNINQNENENINQQNFETISSWYIPRTLKPYNNDGTEKENREKVLNFRFDFSGNTADRVQFDSLPDLSQHIIKRLDVATSSQTSVNWQMTNTFDELSKVHIILDDAGCGKTAYFTWLASYLSRNDPSLCVIRMHALNYSADFNELQKAHFTPLDTTTTIKILLRLFQLTLFATTVNILSLYESNEIRKQAKQSAQLLTVLDGKVAFDDDATSTLSVEQLLVVRLFTEKLNASQFVLLFDGFDEIAPAYKEFVMAFLGKLATFAGIQKLYLSSRPYNFMNDLKNTFNSCKIYQLNPFSRIDQQNLMHKHLWKSSAEWRQCNKTDRYRLLYLLYSLNLRSMNELMSRPLFLHMRSAMLLPIVQQNVDFSRRTVKTTISDQQHIDQLQIVSHFVEQKLRILNTDKCGTTDSASLIPALQQLTLSANKERKEMLKLLAISTMFDEEATKKLLPNEQQLLVPTFIQEIVRGNEKTGIILGVRDDIPQFSHRIFAEYFAACWLFGHKDRFREVNFLRSRSYWKDEFSHVRDFFDRMVLRNSDQCELHMAILNRSKLQVHDIMLNNPAAINQKDALGRFPLHLAAEKQCFDAIELLLENMSDDSINVKDELFGWSALDYAFALVALNTIEILLKHKATVNEQTLLEQIVASNLRDLLYHAHICGRLVEAHEHTKMITDSLLRRVVNYLLDEKRLDIFIPRVDLQNSVVEEIVINNMQNLLKHFVLQSREKFPQMPEDKFIALFEVALKHASFDTAITIVSEVAIFLPKGVDNEKFIQTLKWAIEIKNMKGFVLLFQQLCSMRNIHTVEDMEDMQCDAEDDGDTAILYQNNYPSSCCILKHSVFLRDNHLFERDTIERLLIYAVDAGNKQVLMYLVRKTNTIIRNELIRNIMRLFPNVKNVCHEHSGPAFKYLLDHSIDLHSIDDEGRNLLHWTAQNGCFFMLHCLIVKGFHPLVVNSTNGWSAFHYVAFDKVVTTNERERKNHAWKYFLNASHLEEFDILTSAFDPNQFGSIPVSVSPNQHKQYANILNKQQVCLMAMFVLFDESTRAELLTSAELRDGDQCLEIISKQNELTGIVQGVRNGIPQFCHRIFADYFAACWIFDHKDRYRTHPFFRSKSYWTYRLSQIRYFFDRIVLRHSDPCELHMAVLNQSIKQICDILSNNPAAVDQKDPLGRLPLHLTVVDERFDTNDQLLKKMSVESLNVKDMLFGWSALDYAFANENNDWIYILLERKAIADEKVLFEQTVANNLKELFNHAHACFKSLEDHDHTKLISERFQTNVTKYLIDEKRLNIFLPLDDLQDSSIVELIVRHNIYGLFEQIVFQLSKKIPKDNFIAMIEAALTYRAFDIVIIIVSEFSVSLPHEVEMEKKFETIQCAIKRTNMKAFILLFQQLCVTQNIHTVEDMEDMQCDTLANYDVPSMNVNTNLIICCMKSTDSLRSQAKDSNDQLLELNLLERLLIYAVDEGSIQVIAYVVRKTNTIILNEFIRKIMRLLPKLNPGYHERSLPAFKYLLDHSIDLHSIDDEGRNLLHLMAQNGCFFMLHCLIVKGFDPLAVNSKNGWNAFHYVAFRRDNTWNGRALQYNVLAYVMNACQVDWLGLITSTFDPNEFGSIAVNVSVNEQRQRKSILNKRQVCLMAMFVLFDESTRAELLTSEELRGGDQCLEIISKQNELTGIVQGVRNGIPQFCHRIFVDYFAACWIFDHKDRYRKQPFFRSRSYWADYFSRMRNFFDRMVLRDSYRCELHMAVLNKSGEQIHAILHNSPAVVDQPDAFGRLPLHLAVVDKRLDVLDQLLGKMSLDSINVKDELFGWGAFDYAFVTKNITLIRKFIELNATVNRNVLIEQIFKNNLKDLLDAANTHGQCLLEYESTEQIGKDLLNEVVEKLLEERQLDIFSPLNQLEDLSVIEFCNKRRWFELSNRLLLSK
ncbi:uncharacterized protein LOC121597725 isoform X1 [Anopheles merus]|uniref:uncharacterized protein LOC121597725 isoform X1 n=1 Tax=Anopheles merus TaxID=30066 RepID=UPI001BE470AC|nr:uncharacterized protein LOC121597725 isoform X1 [Anopheles merus]